jgi:hypothetical protein
MDNPLTTVECDRCIAELKQANRQTEPGILAFILPLFLWINTSWLTLSRTHEDGLPPVVFKLYILIMIAISILIFILYRSVYSIVASLMNRHSTQVFSQTELVEHVLALPSDNQAYRGWWRALLAGKPLSFKKERYDACRRAKAIIVCFNGWSRFFGAPAPPWITRLVPHVLFIYLLLAAWVGLGHFFFEHVGLDLASSVDHPAVWDFRWIWIDIDMFSMLLLISPMIALVFGRHAGCRKALIDYFTAEAARLKSASAAANRAARAQAALVAAAEAKLLPLSHDV